MKLSPKKRRQVGFLLLVAALVIGFLVLRKHLPHLDLQKALKDVSNGLGSWTYLLVGAMAYAETAAFIGLIAPGEFAIMVGGAVAGQGDISLPLMIAIAWFCCWAGDTTGFLIGRRLGRGWVIKHGPKLRITRERFAKVEGHFERHGGSTVIIGRFLGLVRPLAPFMAGSSGMRYSAFLPYSILGTGLWSATFTLIGYFASRSLDRVASLVGRGTFLFGTAVAIIVAAIICFRFLRVPENRKRLVAEMEAHAATRWLPRLGRLLERPLRRPGRFVRNRLTRGGLGLEFTTLLSVAAVSSFVVIAYATVVGSNPGPTPADRVAFDVVDSIRAQWMTDLVRAVSFLGSAWVTIPLGVGAAVWLASERRWAEFWVLVVASVLIYLFVIELKIIVDRPRPPDPLVQVAGKSYPSGHAAHSTLYVWFAVTLAYRVRRSLVHKTTLILTGVAISALIGLTRVYLHVHYLSDVLGGWGLGLACFSGCAAVAVAVAHLRQNPPRRRSKTAEITN